MPPCVVLVVYSVWPTDDTPPATYLVVREDKKLQKLCEFFQKLFVNKVQRVVYCDQDTPNNIKVEETNTEFTTGAFSPYNFPNDDNADSFRQSAMHYVNLVRTNGTSDFWNIMHELKERDSSDFFKLEFTISYLGQEGQWG